MPIEVKAPTIGESVSEIYIGQWHKAEGERVEQDEPLVELESDKATLDLPAPASGVLQKILKQSGDTAQVGEALAIIDEAGAAPATSAKRDRGRADEEHEEGEHKEEEPQEEEPEEEEESDAAPAPAPDTTPTQPAPAKEAQRHDAAAARQGDRAVRAPDDQQRAKTPAPAQAKPTKPAGGKESAPTAPIPPAASPADRREERIPLSPLRRQIADRLVRAQQTAALLTTFNEADMSAVKELRAEAGERFERKHGVRLGFMSFFVKAAVEALRDCPELNAIIDDDAIVYRRYYDVGVAVSTDKGLVVPVLRDADQMSFADMERAIEDLANRARSRALRVDELQGGTFTITNGGVFGSLLSTPIVNPPQSGVLGMHAIQDRPVVHGGQVVARPMMYLALTYDHRLVDGREAVTFLRRVKETVESPARLLLEA